jgi:serine/threonine protein phosphatase PrpC
MRKKMVKEKSPRKEEPEIVVVEHTSSVEEEKEKEKERDNVFDMWRKAAEEKKIFDTEKSDTAVQDHSHSDWTEGSADKRDLEYELPSGLISSFGIAEDINKAGLARSKKRDFNPVGRKGPQMEDTNFCACPFNMQTEVGLFCVFDGHAGNSCSVKLTTMFPKIFTKYWKNLPRNLMNKVDMMNFWRQVYREIDDCLKRFEYEGSTATSVLIWQAPDGKRYLQCANIGDSTAFLCRFGLATLLSEDHKPTLSSERKRLNSMGVTLGKDQTRLCGLAVSRAFGDFFIKAENCGVISEPYISEIFELGPGDTRIILASDGLWDIISGQAAFDIIKKIPDSQLAAKKLIDTALKSIKCIDNVTVIVINLQNPK